MPSAYDALDDEIKEELDGLICEHSNISRQQVGFTDFTDEEIDRLKPVRQTLIRKHPATGRSPIFIIPCRSNRWPVRSRCKTSTAGE